jgi:hypothetical protein
MIQALSLFEESLKLRGLAQPVPTLTGGAKLR